MLGSVIGDIIGSPYEFHNIKHKDFELFCDKYCFTDDTILTCATAEWLLTNKKPDEILKNGEIYIKIALMKMVKLVLLAMVLLIG